MGTIIPLLTGLVTKFQASSQVKAVVNLVLSILAGGVSYLIENDGSGTWMELVTAMVAVYLASGVSYTNLWKPTGAATKVQNVIPMKGIGKPVPSAWDEGEAA